MYGTIKPFLLPSFSVRDCAYLGMHMSKAFRMTLRVEFQSITKAATRSRTCHLQWYLPQYVFVDLFALAENNTRQTSTMYNFNNPTKELFTSLMDLDLHQKMMIGKDIVRCAIFVNTITFRYIWFHEAFYWHVVVFTVLQNYFPMMLSLLSFFWIAIDRAFVVSHSTHVGRSTLYINLNMEGSVWRKMVSWEQNNQVQVEVMVARGGHYRNFRNRVRER